ncbi:hypothetical protein CS063_17125 [Sporanaerobium hydrogeniformans]|uniref:Uncharacterized protein n=1 Tax=Sporanaerobium hydrogeniformans TaxID=3072179 RepID=A0AC61D688_9FIRM|nr:PAS domain S-box protein [Sporanaerobium hydrogeniformans]PHV69209.1 hypothetical protein CS063_17125 [Sporanaerobium hydrogeniformans]
MRHTINDLEELLDNSNIGVTILNTSKRYVYINEYACELIQKITNQCYIKENIIGKQIEEIFGKNDIEQLGLDISKVLEEGITRADNCKVVGVNYYLEMEVILTPLRNEDDTVKGCILIWKMIKQSILESKIVKEVPKMKGFIFEKEIQSPIYYKVFKKILDKLQESFKSNEDKVSLAIYYYDVDKQMFDLSVAKGYSEAYKMHPCNYNINEEIVRQIIDVVGYEEVIDVTDTRLNGEYRRVLQKEGISYIMAYPIHIDQHLLGVVIHGTKSDNLSLFYEKGHFYNLGDKLILLIKKYLLVEKYIEDRETYRLTAQKNHLLIEDSKNLFCIMDSEGNFKRTNRELQQVLGYTQEELQHMNFWKLLNINKAGDLRHYVQEYHCPNEKCIWTCWDTKSTHINGKEVIVGIGMDITKEKWIAEKNQKIQLAIAKEKMKNQFFTTLSHEFKTPLNIILSLSQLIRKDLIAYPLDEAYRVIANAIENIDNSVYKLLKMSNDLIDLTRMDMDSYQLNYEKCNIVDVIETITIEVAQFVETATILFDTTIEEKNMYCDTASLERIMINLLSYVLKRVDRGEEILVKLEEKEMIYISIQYKELLNETVKKEARIETNSGDLGLNVAEKIAKLQNGSITYAPKDINPKQIVFKFPIEFKEEEKVKEGYKREDLWGAYKLQVELSDIS